MNETETFQHYQVLRHDDGSLWELGRGAMGVTYKAFDVNLRCHVALKVINGQFLDSEMARARFLREARAAAGLRHRNVASVYHLGNDENSFFYSMEFIDGQTVEALVGARGPLPAELALGIAHQVARALGAAAKQGVVHRDIKPANLMVVYEDDDEEESSDGFIVKVIDFGLARSAVAGGEASGHITMGGFVGTPQYASPEQIEEKTLDVRSDIYSLGVTLWYMLAGKPPFTGTVFRISSQHLSKEPPWADLEATVPEPVRSLLARMLQKEPDQRPQTAGKLRAEIEECLRQLPSTPGGAPSGARRYTPSADTVLPEEDGAANATVIQGPSPTVGRIFAGRYQLAALAGEGPNGQVFRAYDGRLDGKLVAVEVLGTNLHLSPQTFYHLQGDLGRLRDAPHPQLIENHLLERVHGYKYRVMEWVHGYPLATLLGSRGALPLRDALRLVGQAADAAVHGSAHRLHRLELGPQEVLLHFPGLDPENNPPTLESLADRPLDQWPRFGLKIDALNPAREASRSSAGGTVGKGSSKPEGRDTFTSIQGLVEGSYFYALGALLRAMLGGPPVAPAALADAPSLEGLGEEGNAVLRQAFSTNPGFATENEWFHTLLRACGLRREDVGLPKATAEDAPRANVRPNATVARSGAPEIATRTPREVPRPTEARSTPRPAAPATPPKPFVPPPRAEEEQTITEDRAITLVPPASPTPAPRPATERAVPPVVPVELPTPAILPPSATLPVKPASSRQDEVFADPTAPVPSTPDSPAALTASVTPSFPTTESEMRGEATMIPTSDPAEAATFAPVESPAQPSVRAPLPIGAAAKPAKRSPLVPVLAGAALLLAVGMAILLVPKTKVADRAKLPVRAEGSPPSRQTPSLETPVAPLVAAEAAPTTPALPSSGQSPALVVPTPPPVSPLPRLQEAPAVMENVPDEAPPQPPVAIPAPSDQPVVPPAIPTPPSRPEKVPSPSAPTPKANRPSPTPVKGNNAVKATPKPRATPQKGKATPPPRKDDENVPAFLR